MKTQETEEMPEETNEKIHWIMDEEDMWDDSPLVWRTLY